MVLTGIAACNVAEESRSFRDVENCSSAAILFLLVPDYDSASRCWTVKKTASRTDRQRDRHRSQCPSDLGVRIIVMPQFNCLSNSEKRLTFLVPGVSATSAHRSATAYPIFGGLFSFSTSLICSGYYEFEFLKFSRQPEVPRMPLFSASIQVRYCNAQTGNAKRSFIEETTKYLFRTSFKSTQTLNISETTRDIAIVTIERQQEVICALSNGDLE